MDRGDRIAALSRRELQVARAYASGGSYRRIAEDLYISPATVRTHLGTIYRKLGVSTKIDLLRALDDAGETAKPPPGAPVDGHESAADVAAIAAATTAKSPHLDICVIDGLILRDQGGAALRVESPQHRALVGYLALCDGYADAANRVATLLWPERRLPEALDDLPPLCDLRGPEGTHALVVYSQDVVALNSNAIHVDVVRILENLADGRVDDLLLWRGDWTASILPGYEAVSPLYAAWLRVARHGLRDRAVEVLENALESRPPGEPTAARIAAALLALDPEHELAIVALLRHHEATTGSSPPARPGERLRATLQSRFGIEVSEATLQVADALPGSSLATLGTTRATRVPAIAVGNFSVPAAYTTHAAGFQAELVAGLARVREWTVLETSGNVDPADADYLLDGRLALSGRDARLYVTLVEAGTRRVVWSDRLEIPPEGWLDAQRKVVGRVASALEIHLSQDRLARIQRRLPQRLDTYDAWLRGEDLLTRWSHDTEDVAETLFKRVIAEDPGFAPAHASLASVYNARHFIHPGIGRDEERIQQALALGRRAVEIDPIDARNHLVLAWSSALAARFEQSAFHYGLAAELNPDSPRTLVSTALGLAFTGNVERAGDLLERAMELTSLFLDYQWSHIATVRYFLGDFEGTVSAAERSDDVIIDTPGWAAAALLRLDREDEARKSIERLQSAVAARWAGIEPPTTDTVLDWFLGAFPIRNPEIVKELASLRSLGHSRRRARRHSR